MQLAAIIHFLKNCSGAGSMHACNSHSSCQSLNHTFPALWLDMFQDLMSF